MRIGMEDICATAAVIGAVAVAVAFPKVAVPGLAAGLLALAIVYATARRREHAAARDHDRIRKEHRLLLESIETNPMPFALYDNNDVLIAWNQAYEITHATAFALLRNNPASPIRYADLIRITAAATVPPEELEAHVAERVARQRAASGGVDRQYPGLGWLRISKFVTPSGAVAGFAMDINELKQREAELEKQIRHSRALEGQLRIVANTDDLTELPNRRCFLAKARREFLRARRYGNVFSVIMLDIDDFKFVNDTHGHETGDRVIVGVARAASAELRSGIDTIGRIGGEEFAILLPQTDLDNARTCAERIRRVVGERDFDADGHRFRVTVSLGVTVFGPADQAFPDLLNRADRALYMAKELGRDRVVYLDAGNEPSRPSTTHAAQPLTTKP